MKLLPFLKVSIWLGMILLFSCSSNETYQPTYTWSPVAINEDIVPTRQIEDIIVPYRHKLDSIMDEVIGHASHDLTDQGKYESTLGTFVTRLLLEQARASYNRPVDIAIMNHHGGLRAPINEGEITLGDIFAVMPFENEVLLLDLPGTVLQEIVQFISKSGGSMIWPVSFKVTDQGVEDILIAGKQLDLQRTYTLSVSDYQANGGSGFWMLKELKRQEIVPIKLRDLIIKEIKENTAQGDAISAEVANAITVITP